MSSQQDIPQKGPSKNLKIGSPLSPPPNHALLPLTHDLTILYWLSISWWGLGLVRVSFSCMSKICLLLMHLLWLTCIVCCPFLIIFWFFFPLWLALFGAGPCLIVGFAFSSAHHFFCYHLLSYHSIIPVAKLFCLNLVGPLWAYRSFFP